MKFEIRVKFCKSYYPGIDQVLYDGHAYLDKGEHGTPCEGFSSPERMFKHLGHAYTGLMREVRAILEISRRS